MDQKELQIKIRSTLREKNAVLLAHYYQRGEVQEIADILGDSLTLSMGAAQTNADIIVFAGVHFMAESASIICPDKTVLLPRLDVGCPLADMITAEQLIQARKDHPGVPIVTYINSTAETKAHSDICCTSSNALKVVESLEEETVIMAPDGNLARYVAGFTKKKIIPWNGYCPVHNFLMVKEVEEVKKQYPRAPFIAHPECTSEVLAMADFVGSTGAMLRFVGQSEAREIIVGTEMGILYQLKKQNPKKTFIPASKKLICRNMKRITLNNILSAISGMKHVVSVSEEIKIPAKRCLDRMLAIP